MIKRDVVVSEGAVELEAWMCLPDEAGAMILFAHGSGSSRLSPRNRFVASQLQEAGFGTMLLDLLTEDEAGHRRLVFDIDLLAQRLNMAKKWVLNLPGAPTPIGYFGASTGAGAALAAAGAHPSEVFAVVSRGGRPDLAGSRLNLVRAPTLLIVGERDELVADLNRRAQRRLTCESEMVIVASATHLFEEEGALEEVARLAVNWFSRHLPKLRL